MFGQKNIFGGKKMSAILMHAEDSLVLFSDPDVLWYKSPIHSKFLENDLILKISKDNSHNYDTELINKLDLHYLYNLPPINCGVILAKGNLYRDSSEIIKKSIKHESLNPGKFAEQTIFALMIKEIGQIWENEEITANIDDVLSPIFKRSSYTKELIARHYVWKLSWMFWRDIILKPKIVRLAN